MSQQLKFSAFASTLAMALLAVVNSAPGHAPVMQESPAYPLSASISLGR